MANLAASKPKVTAGKRPPKKPAFVCLARAVLLYPPIAHRHHTPAAKNFLLSPFEFAVALAVIAAATRQWSEDRHALAFEDGGERIQRQKHKLQAAKRNRGPKTKNYPFTREQREWEHLIRTGHEPSGKEPVNVKRIMKSEGRKGYDRSQQWQHRQGPPPTIRVRQSRRSLLTSVGLSTQSASYVQLEKALDRLVDAPVAKQPPVLTAWQLRPDGQVRFRVNGFWLDLRRGGFARLPLPLIGRLSSSPNALALYLFLNAIRTFNSRTGIRPRELFARLGMAMSRRGRSGSRLSVSLRLALKTINKKLAQLDDASLRKHKLDAVPRRYEIELIGKRGDRRIRFLAIPRHLDREDMEEFVEQRKRAQTSSREEDDLAPEPEASYEPEWIEPANDVALQVLRRKLTSAEGGSDYD